MNVIFLDFDGVINTLNKNLKPLEDENAMERRIKILGDICKKYDCKVVIESSHKEWIDEITLKTDVEWIKNMFDLFEKYGIECVGRVPNIQHEIEPGRFVDLWKEDEIIEYLNMHPEVEHFCVLDDDDLVTIPARENNDFSRSDLNKVRDYLISPLFYSNTNPNEAGLQMSHIDEVGEILKKENIFKTLEMSKRTK